MLISARMRRAMLAVGFLPKSRCNQGNYKYGNVSEQIFGAIGSYLAPDDPTPLDYLRALARYSLEGIADRIPADPAGGCRNAGKGAP